MAPVAASVPDLGRLVELVGALQDQPVLLLGDLVADRFITGNPKRISREAPVLILSYEGDRLVPGGGANAAANVAALGGRPLPVGIVGDDANGELLVAELVQLGIDTGGVCRKPGYRTPTKTRILAGFRHGIKQQVVRFDVEDRLVLDDRDCESLRRSIRSFEGRARVAVVSDYGFGVAEPWLLTELRQALGEGGIVLCDSRHRLAAFQGLDGATPNEEEAETLLGGSLGESSEEIARRGQELRRRLATPVLLVTRGSRGMSLLTDELAAHIPVHGTDQVADVTGAGDTVIGTFAVAMAAGASPLEAALLADYAGGVVVMKVGTATVSRQELEAAVRSDARPREGLEWARS